MGIASVSADEAKETLEKNNLDVSATIKKLLENNK